MKNQVLMSPKIVTFEFQFQTVFLNHINHKLQLFTYDNKNSPPKLLLLEHSYN